MRLSNAISLNHLPRRSCSALLRSTTKPPAKWSVNCMRILSTGPGTCPDNSAGSSRTRDGGMSIIDVLDERGLIKDLAGDKVHFSERTKRQRVRVYSGVDPTASSMHLGHLIPLNILIWFYSHGHHAISVVSSEGPVQCRQH